MKGKSVAPPVYLTATYKFENSDDLIDVVQNKSGYIYSRWDNPTVNLAEQKMAKLERYDKCLGFSSGMAAISTSILANLRKGGRVVSIREVYGGTYELLYYILPSLGIETVAINCHEKELLLKEINKGLDILYLETPTNPLLRVVDVVPLIKAAHDRGAIVILDSTFASPINQSPIEWDVDIVIHSATKYIGGHHDITAGFACCKADYYDAIWNYRKIFGGVMDAMTAFLALRGLETLSIRVNKQNENAAQIAEYLENHPKIAAVHYPGLPSHPDHQIAKRMMKGFGGMISFEVRSDFDGTKAFMDQLKAIKLATSLGGVTSLANQPITNTHAALDPEARKMAGIKENLVRLSVGIEEVNLLISDLEQALNYV